MTEQEVFGQRETKSKSELYKNAEDIFSNCASTVEDKYHWSSGTSCWREQSSHSDLKEHSWK